MVLTTPVKMHAYSPQKMHKHSCMRAYATVQKLLCHGSYCERILSLARASCRLRLSFAAHPPPVSTKSVARRCSLKKFVQIHGGSLLWYRTSIIRSSVLVQASSSLSMGCTPSVTTELAHHRDIKHFLAGFHKGYSNSCETKEADLRFQ